MCAADTQSGLAFSSCGEKERMIEAFLGVPVLGSSPSRVPLAPLRTWSWLGGALVASR